MKTRYSWRNGRGLGLAVTVAFSIAAITSCGKPMSSVTNAQRNEQSIGGADAQTNFADLINNYALGKPKHHPWAGYWWPYTDNGIAAGTYGGGLSPAGKYDAARGHQTHAQDWEVQNHGSRAPDVKSWTGHCNGWCAAAALYDEPTHSETVNGITFTVGDIKGLLAEAGMYADADFYGHRVDSVQDMYSPKYTDTVPDQYFLVLTNYMGVHQQPILIDRYTTDQIWNQPVLGYQIDYPKPSDYMGEDPSAPGVYRIHINSTVWWANDSGVIPDIITPEFDFQDASVNGMPVIQSRTLGCEIWLDGPVVFDNSGRIIKSGNVIVTRNGDYDVGGAWDNQNFISSEGWPDYMWVPFSIVTPTTKGQTDENPWVEIKWLEQHLENRDYPNGLDDATTHGGNIDPAPHPLPSVSPSPSPAHGSGSHNSGSSSSGGHSGCSIHNLPACLGIGGGGGINTDPESEPQPSNDAYPSWDEGSGGNAGESSGGSSGAGSSDSHSGSSSSGAEGSHSGEASSDFN